MKLSYELYGVKRLKGLYIALFKFISDKKMRRCTFVKQYDMTIVQQRVLNGLSTL